MVVDKKPTTKQQGKESHADKGCTCTLIKLTAYHTIESLEPAYFNFDFCAQ